MKKDIQTTPKNKGGRPPKFSDLHKFQKKIDKYFKVCDSRKKEYVTKDGIIIKVSDPRPYTVTGLATYLGTTREVLLHYEKEELILIPPKERQKFIDAIRRAKMRIHNYAEESLWTPRIGGGIIFNLTNNWGWRDEKKLEIEGGVVILPAKEKDSEDIEES